MFEQLLIGSSTVLLVVYGAKAADPLVPLVSEPVASARACDIYGAGFQDIPGTEASLQISGYVRYEHRYES